MIASVEKCVFIIVASLVIGMQAHATTYLLTIKNGSSMPLSPAVVYVKDGQAGNAELGQESTNGFIQLCKEGDTSLRYQELKNDNSVKFATQTTTQLLPGESKTIEVDVMNPPQQSIHFEMMYSKSKDICAVGSIGNHSLHALMHHMSSEIVGKDDVLLTGSFLSPVLTGPGACMNAISAVACLRKLSLPNQGKAQQDT